MMLAGCCGEGGVVEGTPFGRYRLEELLGRGGMGEVWRAYDTVTDRVVAVKVLPAQLAKDQTFLQRFRREAEAAAQLNNPHIIPIHDYGEIDGRLFVNMRLIEGRDLEQVLAHGPLEPGRAVRIIEGIALALHAAHKVGLVHRDVKPSNILLDEDDFAYLIDFGLARGTDQSKLTNTGGVIGTWAYMAPERMRAGEVDARADIYALACVLYECLTGSPPFPGDTFESQALAHLTDPPPRPSSTRAELSEQFDPVIEKGMAKDPDERYTTTVELAREARDAVTTPIPRPAAAPPPQPPTVHRPAPSTQPATQGERTVEAATRPATRWSPSAAPPGGVSPNAPTRHADPPPPGPPPGHSPPVAPAPRQPPPRPSPRQRRRPRNAVIAAIIVLTVAAIGMTTGYLATRPSQHETARTSAANPPSSTPVSEPQTVLPFTVLTEPTGVAVDTAGSVYVTEYVHSRVFKLAAGSNTPTVLPFTGLNEPQGVAVDTAGTVYATNLGNKQVLKFAAGSSTPAVLPFTGLNDPVGVAVDNAGSVYVTDLGNDRVVKLAAGSSTQTVLPFTGLHTPSAVAVDNAGSVYVTANVGHSGGVLKLAAGSSTQTALPFTAGAVAVDNAGSVYFTDNVGHSGRVLKLAAGSNTPTVLAFTGLHTPSAVAVDNAGGVYVVDNDREGYAVNNRVLKLSAG